MGSSLSAEPTQDDTEPEDHTFQSHRHRMDELEAQSLAQAKKLRNPQVTILAEILTEKGKLNEKLVKENNAILKEFLDTFIEEMKKSDKLFELLFQKIYYTGSYYSDLRVRTPDEYDLNLVLKFPFKPNTVSEILTQPFSDYLRHNGKCNSKEKTANNYQDIKHKNCRFVKNRKKLQQRNNFVCKNKHDLYSNPIVQESTTEVKNSHTKNSNQSNQNRNNEKLQFCNSRGVCYQRRQRRHKNNNAFINLGSTSKLEVGKQINYEITGRKNTSITQEKQVIYRKRTVKNKYPECKNNVNAHSYIDNLSAQIIKRNFDCLTKSNKWFNKSVYHEKLRFVSPRRFKFPRRHSEYKSINDHSNLEDRSAEESERNGNYQTKDKEKHVRFRKKQFQKYPECKNIIAHSNLGDRSAEEFERNRNYQTKDEEKHVRFRKRQFQKYPECKNTNAHSNLGDRSTEESERNGNYQTKDKEKHVRFRKRQFQKYPECKNLINMHGNQDVSSQKIEKEIHYHPVDAKISYQNINNKKISFTRNRNFQRKHNKYKNINNTYCDIQSNKALPKTQNSVIRDHFIKYQKYKNVTVNNNQDLNWKKIEVNKEKERKTQRKKFRNKKYKSLNMNVHPNKKEFEIQCVNHLYVQYNPQVPSYAKYSTTEQDKITEKGLTRFFKEGYLIPNEVRTWLQGVVDKALRTYQNYPRNVKNIRTSGSGPARTIILVKQNGVIDIDLVPAIECTMDLKPPGIHGKVYEKVKNNLRCFLVPKPYQTCKQAPINETERARLWRTHYPDAETNIIHNLGCVKPVIKLLKLLRDKENWKILASYYLKTVVMWMILENSTPDYWKLDRLGERFMEALNILDENVRKRKICYFFSSRYNLLEKLPQAQADNIDHRLISIINSIRRDPQNLWTVFGCNPTF